MTLDQVESLRGSPSGLFYSSVGKVLAWCGQGPGLYYQHCTNWIQQCMRTSVHGQVSEAEGHSQTSSELEDSLGYRSL